MAIDSRFRCFGTALSQLYLIVFFGTLVEKPLGGAVVGRHSAWSVVLFSAFLKAEKAVQVQLSCAGSFHLGLNDELVVRFAD
jgi:hypothetical protein